VEKTCWSTSYHALTVDIYMKAVIGKYM